MTNTKTYINAMFSLSPFAYLLSFMISILSESTVILTTMVIFVFVDLITGIWKSIKLKSTITSKALRSTLEKILGYFFVIILAKLFDETILMGDFVQVHVLVTSLIFLVEFKSVTENMSIITGNKIFIQIYSKVNELFNKKSDGKDK